MENETNTNQGWQNAGFSCHKAAEFTNATGDRILCLQMVKDGRAYAVADFRNEKVERFDAVHSLAGIAGEWLAMQIKLAAL